jgi:dihydroorotate dehydrogenase
MGFNNLGADALARRIADARPHLPADFVIGVNIGRNRDGSPATTPLPPVRWPGSPTTSPST